MRHLAAILLLTLTARATEPMVIGDGELGATSLASHLEVLVDPEGKLSAEEAMRGDWKPETRPVPTFGYTRDTIWLRFKVRSEAKATQTVYVDLATALLSHLRWHVIGEGGLRGSIDGGSADSPTARGKVSRLPLLRLELPPGVERTVLLRAASNTAIWLPLNMMGAEAHRRMEDSRSLPLLLQVGFYLALAFLALLLGVTQRQSAYLLLVVMALGNALYTINFNGFIGRVWPDSPQWMEREGMLIPAVLSLLAFMRLNRHMLDRRTMTRTERLLQGFSETVILLTAVSFLVLDYRIAAQTQSPALILGILASLVAAISRLRRQGGKLEGAFVVAWSAYAVVILWLALSFRGLIPMPASVAKVQSLLLPTVLSAFFVAVVARQRSLQQAELQLEKSRTAESQAKLEALRYQINPHFLFNTLTSIDGLARTEPGRVPGLVTRLATFLRLRLVARDSATLRDELESAKAYLEIEQARFGQDLSVDCQAENAVLDWKVPELILQPLAENAVKHGVRAGTKTTIMIRARAEAGQLVVEVANNGGLAPAAGSRESLGVGLENIRKRLEILHGPRASLGLSEKAGWVVATLIIPAEPNP